jgi:hypothetical protein
MDRGITGLLSDIAALLCTAFQIAPRIYQCVKEADLAFIENDLFTFNTQETIT